MSTDLLETRKGIATRLGGVHIQRRRWERCGEIARAALERKP
jgi:hypothetical protein